MSFKLVARRPELVNKYMLGIAREKAKSQFLFWSTVDRQPQSNLLRTYFLGSVFGKKYVLSRFDCTFAH